MSDSEDCNNEVEDNEGENQTRLLQPSLVTPPIYHTPYIPNTGLMFWGSPDASTRKQKAFKDRKPLPCATPIHHHAISRGQNTHRFHTLIQNGPQTEKKPLAGSTLTNHAPPPQFSLTTPSSNKYFPRYKSQMIAELYDVFNKSVFDGKVLKKYILL